MYRTAVYTRVNGHMQKVRHLSKTAKKIWAVMLLEHSTSPTSTCCAQVISSFMILVYKYNAIHDTIRYDTIQCNTIQYSMPICNAHRVKGNSTRDIGIDMGFLSVPSVGPSACVFVKCMYRVDTVVYIVQMSSQNSNGINGASNILRTKNLHF